MMLRKINRVLWGIFWWGLLTLGIIAQEANTPIRYFWEPAQLALTVPENWDPPIIVQADVPTLDLAQAFASTPQSRPPAIPIIRLMLYPPEQFSLLDIPVENALESLDLRPIGPFNAELMGQPGVMFVGSDADDILYGIGIAAYLPTDDLLLVVGRTSTEQRAAFNALLYRFAHSLSADSERDVPQPTQYGVGWHTVSLATDGDEAFLDLRGITPGETGRLYAVDEVVGVLTLDASNGAVLAQLAPPDGASLSDIVQAPDGTLYAADTACNCIHVSDGSTWAGRIDGFNLDAPQQIAISGDGTLYATDQDEQAVFLRAFAPTGEETTLFFEDSLIDQPLLAITPAGELRVISLDGVVYQVEGVGFTPLFELRQPPSLPNGAAVDTRGRLLIASSDEGLVVFDATGEAVNQIGQFADGIPLPGDLIDPQDVVVGANGTVYWVDGDGSSGNVTSASPNIPPDRVGETVLVPGGVVQGVLADERAQQVWTFDGVSGQTVSLNVLGFPQDRDYADVMVRLFSPDGREVAANDNHEGDMLIDPGDARIDRYRLDRDGVYVVAVNAVQGFGRYQLGFSTPRTLDISGGDTQISGVLSDALPVQDWTFEANAGQILTLTMAAESGSIDPLLQLKTPRGDVLAENDNADDLGQGVNAQLVAVRIPASGVYTVSAGRFLGEGRYTLSIITGD